MGRSNTNSVPKTFRNCFFSLNNRIRRRGLMKYKISARFGRTKAMIVAAAKETVAKRSNVCHPELKIRLLPHVNILNVISIENKVANRQESHEGSPVSSIHLISVQKVFNRINASATKNYLRPVHF